VRRFSVRAPSLWITSAGSDDLRHDAGMVYALDPRIHRVWRSPSSLQFGVDRAILTLDDLSNAEERMLVALDAGITMSGLQMVARRARADAGAPARLLERLTPVLAGSPAEEQATRERPVAVVDGAGHTAVRLIELLDAAGVDARSGLTWDDPAVDTAAAAIVVGSFAIEPERHRRWLRRDVPHLAIVFGDDRVRVGPFVDPGAGPCLGCVDLRLTDADPAWPAMASQLYTRDARSETPLVGSAAASVAGFAVLDRLGGGRALGRSSVTIDYADGARAERSWEPHPACGCTMLPAPDR
jgi:bacteriocin biosynthesis cyclodehydratase domain-containing protein